MANADATVAGTIKRYVAGVPESLESKPSIGHLREMLELCIVFCSFQLIEKKCK